MSEHNRIVWVHIALNLVAEAETWWVPNLVPIVLLSFDIKRIGADSDSCWVLGVNVEHATSSRDILNAVSSLPSSRDVYSVVDGHEIVPRVTACTNPRRLPQTQRRREQSRVHGLTLNSLLLNAVDLLHIGSVHEFLQAVMHKQKVAVLKVM